MHPTSPGLGSDLAARRSPNLQDIHAAIRTMQRLSEVFRRRREQLAASVGITEREWGVLDGISSEDFIPSMFARRRDSTPGAVSKHLRQLIDKGLIKVAVSKADGRQRDYALTAKGRRVLAELRAKREDAVREVWMKLEPAALIAFSEFGDLLAARLEAYAGLGDTRAEAHSTIPPRVS
ncbi:MAG: winged helix-turn-helix transcriptional regulator [Polyangiaceae bacterium]|nr:winged helix-turn-helix transcriptional regulator [Polyangiaceae bacterium]MCW5789752.1 winged helix-turn-helix transcriptional regulator [Polyangiaceae bacterium]